ncbi:aspartate ammonia-lyase [Bifidobacterium moukalabense]|uniref:Aspartate ammonia-lyase n=1 Tax=Bifidobacterium moukalabense DSM 27321 TaxID=1435051 RepID=W4N7V8_9BIFI|nr:aspartate ammonia-lyase [Bifidobacterium moukalabense]ETY70735.1 aspartate ammonia-lyase [Bifidobacterium moukalabense DSM 27321]
MALTLQTPQRPIPTTPKAHQTRTEHDCIGTAEIPADAYWGIHTLRAIDNFPVSDITVGDHPELIRAYAQVKRACARANGELNNISAYQAALIDRACEDVASGELNDQFPVDVLQGGAGTSTNMNMNEVIANRALELGHHARGEYGIIHPNDTVNRSQSTNDTYPAACRLALIDVSGMLADSTRQLAASFRALSERTMPIVKIGRTQLQDAVPMTFGQEFGGFASQLDSDARLLESQQTPLAVVNLGGTAIGTGICADIRFRERATRHLAELSGLPIRAAADPVGATSDVGDFVTLSGVIKRTALHLGKIANDLRLLASGPRAGLAEIQLPVRQAGSSIMPGKVNPVIPECVNQCVYMVVGMDATVSCAAEAGQLQLNAFEPVMLHALLTGMHTLANAMDTLRERCVDGITVNEKVGMEEVMRSSSLATPLIGYIGYEQAMAIAQEALDKRTTVYEIARKKKVLSPELLDSILNPRNLIRAY